MARTPLSRQEPAETRIHRRLQAVERRPDTPDRVPRPDSSPGGKRFAEIVIAGDNSSDLVKAAADYVCDGVDDHEEFDDAIAAIVASPYGSGRIVVMGSDYYFGAKVTTTAPVTLQGQGAGATNIFNFDTAEEAFVLAAGCVLEDMYVDANGTYAVDASAANVEFAGVLIGAVLLGNDARVVRSRSGDVVFGGIGAVVTGHKFSGNVSFLSTATRCRMTGSSFYGTTDVGRSLSLDGIDNVVDACTFISRAAVDNTGEVVSIDGTRNSLIGCVIRSSSGVLRPQYGVEVLAGAVDARPKFNDLRSGSGGWGTGGYFDAGTGTLASDNDT